MNELRLKGQVEVILTDENGNVKCHEVKDNTITRTALKYMLYQMLSTGGLNTVTRANTGSVTSASAPGNFGIYVMSTPVEIEKDVFRPPYIDKYGEGLHPDVTFYCANGSTTESSKEMVPVDSRCFLNDKSEVEFSLEYAKTSFTGIVRSVMIGRSHANSAYSYQMFIKDNALPPESFAGTVNYLLEHTANGTIVHKTVNESTQYSTNLKTKEFATHESSFRHGNITNQFGGLIKNETIFKATRASASGVNYNVNLTYVRDWESNTTHSTLSIPFKTRDGMSVNTSVHPLILARPDKDVIEIFVTMSIGNHDGKMGANIKKAVVDISDIDNITYEIVDIGVIPYAISSYNTAVGTYNTGFFANGEYYLPFYYRINPATGGIVSTTSSSFGEGVVISEDFETEHKTVCFRHSGNQFYPFVQADEITQCLVNTTVAASNSYAEFTQVLSGTNLDTPVTKGANDILRVIYRYKLA